MKPREARVAIRRDVAERKAHRVGAAVLEIEPPSRLLAHPWHVPTDEELALAAEAQYGRLFRGSRGGSWSSLSDEQKATRVAVMQMHAVDVVGPTAVRVLEQAAERADAEGCPKVAAWLRSLSREVEV